VCQLRRHLHPALEAGRDRPLPLQRVRTVLQDERGNQPTAPEARTKTTGEYFASHLVIVKWSFFVYVKTLVKV